MPEKDPDDPKGLIREAYRIEGISEPECRSIFMDWALSSQSAEDARPVIAELLAPLRCGHAGSPDVEGPARGARCASKGPPPRRSGGTRFRWRGRRMKRLLALVGFVLVFLGPAAAQAPLRPGIFLNYETMQAFVRARLGQNDIVGLMSGLLPPGSIDQAELYRFQNFINSRLSAPVTGFASVRSSTSPDGVREEILALWTANDEYMYLSLVTHPRGDDLVVLMAFLDGSLGAAYDNF